MYAGVPYPDYIRYLVAGTRSYHDAYDVEDVMEDLNEAARWYCNHEMTAVGGEDGERDR